MKRVRAIVADLPAEEKQTPDIATAEAHSTLAMIAEARHPAFRRPPPADLVARAIGIAPTDASSMTVMLMIAVFAFGGHARGQQREDATTPALWMITEYQTYLSPSKADTCSMYPSCSEYARQAYERYPFWKATLIATDRLNRSDHDSGRYEMVEVAGRRKQYDPLPGAPYEPPTPNFKDSGVAPIHPVDVMLAKMDPGLSDEEQALDFARYLHAFGMTEVALAEYLRFLRRYPESPLASTARVNVMQLHYDAREFRDAILWAEQSISEDRIADVDLAEVKFWISAAHVRLNNPERARAALPPTFAKPELLEKIRLLEAYTYAQQGDWTRAASGFRQYEELGGSPARAEALTSVAERAMYKNRKKPALAGVLGIVPGLGYLYAGYPASALSAFVLDSLLLGASYKAFEDGNAPLGAVLGIVGVGWYAGSIYGSVSAAERRNEDDLRDALLQLDLGFRF